jgi:hypothetical protein
MLSWGTVGYAGNTTNPGILSDVFARVGGANNVNQYQVKTNIILQVYLPASQPHEHASRSHLKKDRRSYPPAQATPPDPREESPDPENHEERVSPPSIFPINSRVRPPFQGFFVLC